MVEGGVEGYGGEAALEDAVARAPGGASAALFHQFD